MRSRGAWLSRGVDRFDRSWFVDESQQVPAIVMDSDFIEQPLVVKVFQDPVSEMTNDPQIQLPNHFFIVGQLHGRVVEAVVERDCFLQSPLEFASEPQRWPALVLQDFSD